MVRAGGEKRQETLDNFWGKVNAEGVCWEWLGSLNEKGYGIFRVGTKRVRAHTSDLARAGARAEKGSSMRQVTVNKQYPMNSELLFNVTPLDVLAVQGDRTKTEPTPKQRRRRPFNTSS